MIRRYYTGIIFVYTLFLLYMMFFGLGRHASEFRCLQTNPFQTIVHFCSSHIKGQDFLLNVIGNIFVFSPYGWLGITLTKCEKIGPLTFGFLLCIGFVEFMQYQTGRGTADVDDVLLNTFGMLIGYGIMQFTLHANILNFQTNFNMEKRVSIAGY